MIDLAFASLAGDQVPKVADLLLADTVDSAEALFEPVGVPREVIVDHQVSVLEINAFARSIGCQ